MIIKSPITSDIFVFVFSTSAYIKKGQKHIAESFVPIAFTVSSCKLCDK